MLQRVTLKCGEVLTADSLLRAEGQTRRVVILTKRYATFDPPLMVRRSIEDRTPDNWDTNEVSLDLISRNIDEGFWRIVKE